MKKLLRFSLFLSLFLLTTGCIKRVENRVENYDNKAHVELKWKLHTENKTHRGWVIAEGWVINRGSKRADWVQLTIYSKDKNTGVVLHKKTSYIDGNGSNGKSLEPGADARFEVRLDSKHTQGYSYEADITWSEAL